MSKSHANAALPIGSPPTSFDPELAPLLDEPFAQAWQHASGAAMGAAVRSRLMERAAASRAAEAPMTTRRCSRQERQVLAAGVTVRHLYAAPPGRSLRPGEPNLVRLLEFAVDARLQPQALGEAPLEPHHRELLVVAGSVDVQGQTLSQRDYLVLPAGAPMPTLSSATGALLFLRESTLPSQAGERPYTVLDAEAGWPSYAPGIQRRVLWQRDGQAAMLYYTQSGAQVPHHTHGHDEECLMVQGELFLDDLLLQAGDYQLAPAGSAHHITHTDTGVVLYAHGDLDLQFVGAMGGSEP